MSLDPFAIAPVMGLLAATPLAGVPLINGTQVLCTWTAPNDGQMHRVMAFASLLVTSPETGGAVNLSVTLPAPGAGANDALFNGGAAAGSQMSYNPGSLVQPGSTVTVNQATALTAGAATLWAEIWGS